MTSRLDRLFLLLENGGSGVTRQAAAQQLGEVIRLHPHDLNYLLTRVHTYLSSKSWETRIAAGLAIEAIVSNIPQWNPQPQYQRCEDDIIDDLYKAAHGRLSLSAFNIQNVLENGSYLMAADEKHFDAEDENSATDPAERLRSQRQLVNQKLGLDIAQAIGIDTQNLFTNEDLADSRSDSMRASTQHRDAVVNIIRKEIKSAGLGLSSREMNRARRKAKLMARQKSMDVSECADEGPEKKRMRLPNPSAAEKNGSDDEERMVVDEGPLGTCPGEEGNEWPFESFCDILTTDLFSSLWEVRHGAATALRQIIRVHGRGGGKTLNQTKEQMEQSHEAWLEDLAVRLVCVLALDRFGDFVSDQVVAPVRETCAQALGGILHLLSEEGVFGVLGLLEKMLSWKEWEARHGGLLGLKYLLAVREDLRTQLLTHAYPHIYKGLVDEVDDVVAVAAACLVPVADSAVMCLDNSLVTQLVVTLWDSLLDIDDLTSSTNSILLLLSKLLSHLNTNVSINNNLTELVPRLWPFLYHASSFVRRSTLTTLATLTAPSRHISKSEDIGIRLEDSKEGVNLVVKCESTKENRKQTEVLSEVLDKDIKTEDSEPDIKHDTHKITKKEEPMEEEDLKMDISKDNIKNGDENKVESEGCCDWLQPILQPALTHMYQRTLLETSSENLDLVFKIWEQMLAKSGLDSLLPAVCPMIAPWLCLMMANPKVPLEPTLLLIAHHNKSGDGKRLRVGALAEAVDKSEVKFYLGGFEQYSDAAEKQNMIVRARCAAAKLLGRLSHYVIKPMPGVEYPPDETPVLCYIRLLIAHLSSRSAIQRLGAAAVVRDWALVYPDQECHALLQNVLHNCLMEVVYYDEIALSFTRLQQETRDFMAMLRHYKLPLDECYTAAPVLTLEQIQNLSGHIALTLFSGGRLRPKVHTTLEERRRAIQNNVSQTSTDQITLATTTQAMISGTVVRFRILPDKLSPIIKPLMDSIKKEKIEQLQSLAAMDLTKLLELCIDRPVNPSAKVIKNLASFLCVDQEFTPKISGKETNRCESSGQLDEILSLSSQLKNAERQLLKRSSSVSGRGPGRPPANAKREDPSEITESLIDSENQQLAEIQRRGCTIALTQIAQYFGEELPTKAPQLWHLLCDPFNSPLASDAGVDVCQEAVHWLQLVEVVIPALHHSLIIQLKTKLQLLEHWLYHPVSAVRHMTTRVMGALACVLTVPVMTYVVEQVVPALSAIEQDFKRQGAVECIYAVIDQLGFGVVPYIVLLIVPLLGRMSDQDISVRLLATHCFATLIQLLPLEGGVPNPPSLSDTLLQQKLREREFLERLLDPTKIEGYKIPVPVKAELRSYQQNGVNWLSFLNQYKLHGILCDDMGLGKTLQSICILAGDHYAKEQELNKTGGKEGPVLQSLVVCPPTLTGHWVYEIEKFVDKSFLNPLHYYGPPAERFKLRRFIPDHNLIVASYDIVRNDIDFFSQIKWNYVILDEGHVIKNGKTKSSKAIKQLVAHHRLILSGTPIQNNVLELWSLFDFLMPGFLGTERQFTARFAKPILQSRDAKSSSKEQEAGVLAMEALHRQVLPFILRRVKGDVLKDLPPKITQDYYCDLSPLQLQLYEDFSRTQANQDISEALMGTQQDKEETKSKSHSHIFQALQYLRKVCNHPKLVLKPQHPEYERVTAQLKEDNSSLGDVSHSAKLPALKQLLLDCGIGVSGGTGTESVVSQHRALIFCQLKAMLDIIENDLLKAHLPNVTYLRLDGSVPAGSRHSLVQRFNADPSIDLLLLTTQVGGLGLNLIGADTVIFVEHDWNPMRDLQAMDRAHRIGQKRVVNVYRLITRGTLEEKIMGLQKFKMMTANTIISQENSSLLSMATNQLLDLFTVGSSEMANKSREDGSHSSHNTSTPIFGVGGSGAKAVLENLPELWDEDQYEAEYELTSFMKALKK